MSSALGVSLVKQNEKEKISPPVVSVAKWKRQRETELDTQAYAALTTVEAQEKKKRRKSVTITEKVDSDEEMTVSPAFSSSPAQEQVSEKDSGVGQTRPLVKRENAPSVAGYALPETGRRGECNAAQQHFDKGKAMYVESLAGLKRVIRWRSIWDRVQLGLEENISAVVPLAEGTSYEHFIENLQCFSLPAMYMHVHHNPAITEEFTPLWTRLSAHGWKKIHAKNADSDVAALSIESPYIFIYEGRGANKDSKKSHVLREPGVHVFASMIAVMRYIARFPYPLQSDDSLAETLRKHGWGWRGTAKNALFGAPGQETGMSLSEVRDFLWKEPEMLFAAYFDSLGEETIRNALILPLGEALAKEEELVFPPTDNIPLAEKEQSISAIVELSRSLLQCASSRPQIEAQLSLQLQELLWQRETAEKWAKGKWWRFGFVWIPPHAMLGGDHEPKACVDYFFDLRDAARLFIANRDNVSMRLGAQERRRVLGRDFTDLDDQRFSLEKRVEFIVSNSENPFGEHRLEKMLKLAGWKTSRGRRRATLFFPPASEKEEERDSRRNRSWTSSSLRETNAWRALSLLPRLRTHMHTLKSASPLRPSRPLLTARVRVRRRKKKKKRVGERARERVRVTTERLSPALALALALAHPPALSLPSPRPRRCTRPARSSTRPTAGSVRGRAGAASTLRSRASCAGASPAGEDRRTCCRPGRERR